MALAGCFGRRDPEGTPTVSPAPLPAVGDGSVVGVGEAVSVGPLAIVVTDAERHEAAVVLGGEFDPGPDREVVVVTVAFVNSGDRYLSVAVDRFDVRVGAASYDPIEPFVAFHTDTRGGLAFAPGERRAVELHYAVPRGRDGATLETALRVRALPAGWFEPAERVSVDLGDGGSVDLAPLTASLAAPIHGAGDAVTAGPLAVAVRRVVPGVDLPNWDPPPGRVFLAVNLRVTNADERAGPFFVGFQGFGGLSVVDDAGTAHTRTRWFAGEVAGGRYFDGSRAVAHGIPSEGTTVVEVPDGDGRLYLLWTPPVELWGTATDAAVNRYVWRVR